MSQSGTFTRWQEDFAQSLLTDLSPSLQASLQGDSSVAQQQRFGIYQNNVFYSLSNALAELYPVIKQLVGDDFFTGTASYYLRENPPQQAAMVHFGQDFPQFLTQFEHTKAMTYLAPIAELELARQRAYHAEDTQPLAIEAVAQIAPEALASAKIAFHPSLQFVKSAHPIFDIWQSNQEDNDAKNPIDLNEPQQVLVVRPVYDVSMYSIDLGTYHFVDCLSNGHIVQQAIEITLATYPDFDVGNAIHFMLQTQLLTHINVE